MLPLLVIFLYNVKTRPCKSSQSHPELLKSTHRDCPPLLSHKLEKWRRIYWGYHNDFSPKIWGLWAVTPARKPLTYPRRFKAGPQYQRRQEQSYQNRIKWVLFALDTERKPTRNRSDIWGGTCIWVKLIVANRNDGYMLCLQVTQ